MLKQLWDYIFLVRTAIDEWKTTQWKNIDVENMDMECKKFSKDIRGLDKDMRSWDAFMGLEVTVKNMLTSLRAVGELQVLKLSMILILMILRVCHKKVVILLPLSILYLVNIGRGHPKTMLTKRGS